MIKIGMKAKILKRIKIKLIAGYIEITESVFIIDNTTNIENEKMRFRLSRKKCIAIEKLCVKTASYSALHSTESV